MAAKEEASPWVTSVVAARVSPPLKRQLAELAKQNRRSVGQEAAIAIERHVTAEKEKAA